MVFVVVCCLVFVFGYFLLLFIVVVLGLLFVNVCVECDLMMCVVLVLVC